MKTLQLAMLFAAGLIMPSASAQNLTSYSVRTAYDANQRLTQFTVDGTSTIRYDYDASGNVSGIVSGPTGSVDVEPDAGLPTRFALHGAYPNPFNPTSTIGFDLPVPSQVEVTVFDLLGRRVAVLASGPWLAGRHEVSWNAARLPSGTYVIALSAGGRRFSQTVVLLR